MASDPLSLSIVNNAQTKLVGINGSTTYHNNVHGRVSKVSTSSPSVSQFPSLEILVANETPKNQIGYDTFNLYESDLNFEVWGWIQDNSDTQGSAQKLAMDIKTALEADNTIGDTAVDIAWIGTDYFLPADMRGVGVCMVQFRAHFLVNRQDPSEGI